MPQCSGQRRNHGVDVRVVAGLAVGVLEQDLAVFADDEKPADLKRIPEGASLEVPSEKGATGMGEGPQADPLGASPSRKQSPDAYHAGTIPSAGATRAGSGPRVTSVIRIRTVPGGS